MRACSHGCSCFYCVRHVCVVLPLFECLTHIHDFIIVRLFARGEDRTVSREHGVFPFALTRMVTPSGVGLAM